MVALAKGTTAPPLALRAADGADYSLSRTLKEQPAVVLAFFKVSCPVCQFTFPYIERLHRSYRSLPIWGVSQDDADATGAFARMFGCTIPMLLDESLEYSLSFDLTNVPTIFQVGHGLTIEQTIVGFDKAEMEKLNQDLAARAGVAPVPLFTAADEVPALKPG